MQSTKYIIHFEDDTQLIVTKEELGGMEIGDYIDAHADTIDKDKIVYITVDGEES